MKHRPRPLEQDDLLRPRLIDLIDLRHELVKLAVLIDWEVFDREWAGFFPSGKGRPATEPRLVAVFDAPMFVNARFLGLWGHKVRDRFRG
jgi:IS5 family transposase